MKITNVTDKMTKATDLDCSGCKISMFCKQKSGADTQSCETKLKAVAVAFVIPLIGIVVLLLLANGRMSDGWAAFCVLLFLVIYFLIIKIIAPKF